MYMLTCNLPEQERGKKKEYSTSSYLHMFGKFLCVLSDATH